MISFARSTPDRSSAPPWDLLLAITAGLLLVAQARVHVFLPGVSALRPALLMMAAGLAVWVLKGKPLARLGRPVPFGVKLGVFIAVWATIGTPFGLYVGQSARAILGSFATTIIVFLLVVAAIRSIEDVRRLLVFFALGGAVFAIMAPLTGAMESRGFAAGGFDPNDSAMFLVSALPILVFFAVSARRTRWRILSGLVVLLALGAIVDTQSRGGFLGLVAVLLFMLLFYRGIGVLAKTAAVAAVVVGLVATSNAEYWERIETIATLDDGYSQGSEISGRLNIWGRGVDYMLEDPLTGVGLYNFSVAEGRNPLIQERIARGIGTKYAAAHSMWIQIGAELGLPGLLAFLGLFGHVGHRMWRISRWRNRGREVRNGAEGALMASSIAASLVGLAVAGSFLSNAYWAMVWAPLAMGIAMDREWEHLMAAIGSPAMSGGAEGPVDETEFPAPGRGGNQGPSRELRHLPVGYDG